MLNGTIEGALPARLAKSLTPVMSQGGLADVNWLPISAPHSIGAAGGVGGVGVVVVVVGVVVVGVVLVGGVFVGVGLVPVGRLAGLGVPPPAARTGFAVGRTAVICCPIMVREPMRTSSR